MPELSPDVIHVGNGHPSSWIHRGGRFIKEKVIDEHSPRGHERKIRERFTRMTDKLQGKPKEIALQIKPFIDAHAYALGVTQTAAEVTAVVAATVGAYVLAEKAFSGLAAGRRNTIERVSSIVKRKSSAIDLKAKTVTQSASNVVVEKSTTGSLSSPQVIITDAKTEPELPFVSIPILFPRNDQPGTLLGEGQQVRVFQSDSPAYVLIQPTSSMTPEDMKRRRWGHNHVMEAIDVLRVDPLCRFQKLHALDAGKSDGSFRIRKVAGHGFSALEERVRAKKAGEKPMLLPFSWRVRALGEIYKLIHALIYLKHPIPVIDFKPDAYWWNRNSKGDGILLYLFDPPLHADGLTPQEALVRTLASFGDRGETKSFLNPEGIRDTVVQHAVNIASGGEVQLLGFQTVGDRLHELAFDLIRRGFDISREEEKTFLKGLQYL